MRYMFKTGKGVNRRVMHIAQFDGVGNMTGEALCRIKYFFDRTINAPFGLGRPVCKNCKRALQKED